MKKYHSNDYTLDHLIDGLDELPLWSAPFGLKLLEYIDYMPNISAIDIGFGTGFPLTELAMRLGDTCKVYGIDPWKAAIVRVNHKIQHFGITNIRIIEGVAEEIPLENDSVELITSNNGINNVKDLDKVLAECSRILKKNGQFVITMNTDRTMLEFYELLESILLELKMNEIVEAMHRHILQKRPPVDDIVSKLRKLGFAIKDLEQDQFNYRFADGTAMLNHYFIRSAFMDSWINFLPPGKIDYIFDTIESRLNQKSQISGSIKLSIPFVVINAIKY